MAIPTPEPGLVISYAYLWDYEARSGQEEGRKDRPCVIALAAERQPDGETLVTVLPVTHRPPESAAAAVEIPHAVKRHLGLDDARSWVIISEGDQFVWPGYDLRKTPGSDLYDSQSARMRYARPLPPMRSTTRPTSPRCRNGSATLTSPPRAFMIIDARDPRTARRSKWYIDGTGLSTLKPLTQPDQLPL